MLMSTKSKKQVVIVGGGFGGLRVARLLSKHWGRVEITLITDSTTFRYSPALYRSSTGFRMRESIIPIAKITRRYSNLTVVTQKAEKIDREAKSITTDDGKVFKYDIAVLALGVVTSYFDIPGLEEHSFGIKSPESLHKLKTHLHKTLSDTGKPDINYVVVGAGPTGVELSAALARYLKYICKKHKIKNHSIKLELVEAAPRVLPVLAEKASYKTAKRLTKLRVKLMLGEVVKAETSKSLKFADRSIPSRTVIWTAGVTNNPFYKQNSSEFELNDRGKVVVNDHMQVDGHTYVIGDNAATKYGGLALVAVWDANFVAKQIIRQVRGKQPLLYKQKKPISIVPVGEDWSVLQYNKLVLTGKIPAILRSLADLIGYKDIMGINQALAIWSKRNLQEENCRTCKVALID